MSFDRSSAADEAPDNQPPTETPAAPPSDAPDSGESVHPRLPTRDEQIAAYWHTRAATDREYGVSDEQGEGQDAEATRPDRPPESDSHPNQETAATSENTGDAGERSTETDALRQRVTELETLIVDRDKQLAARDVKSAEQDKRIAQLETDLGQVAASVVELSKQRAETQPSTEIGNRAGGGQTERAERAEPQRDARLPSDAVNNVISLVAGGTITELAYHLRDLPAEYAGIGATGVAIGAGLIAVWRERRKAKDDANH
jgi:hypothetical protein